MNRKPPSRLQRFQAFAEGLWDGSSIRFGKKLSRLERFALFCLLVSRNFTTNRCPARAAALSYTTLLALIPMLAVVLSVTSGVLKGESEERIDQFIDKLVVSLVPPANQNDTPNVVTREEDQPFAEFASESPDLSDTASTNAPSAAQAALASLAQNPEVKDVRKNAAREIRAFIQNTRSGTLGVTGTIALVILAIMMLARIEDTFNDIWGVVRGRTWFLRIVLYWAVITLAPLLLISALALASGPHLDTTRTLLSQMPFIGNLIFQFLPVVVLWLAFSAFYMLVPNTKVDWTAALAGGLLCAVLWHVNNSISALYVSRVVTNFKIYGGLGMVPVFMAGLYLSWLFLLLGAQVAYAWQNRGAYLQEKLVERIDQRGREFVALRLMTCVGQYFQNGEPAAPVSELSSTLGVPTRLSQQIMRTLRSAGLVSEVAEPAHAYLPARPLESITCHDILQAMRTASGDPLPQPDEPLTNEVLGEFERIQAAERAAAGSVTLLALVNRAQLRLQLAPPSSSAAEIRVERSEVTRVSEAQPAAPDSSKVHASRTAEDVPPQEPKHQPEAPPPSQAETADAHAPTFTPVTAPPITQPTEEEERTFPL